MSSKQVEHFLACLYTDENLRERFLLEPERVALAAGLGLVDAKGMPNIDKVGLRMAAQSFAKKRGGRASTAKAGRWWQRLWRLCVRWKIGR